MNVKYQPTRICGLRDIEVYLYLHMSAAWPCQPQIFTQFKGAQFLLTSAANVDFFAYCCIWFLLNHTPEMKCQPQFFAAANFDQLRQVKSDTKRGLIFQNLKSSPVELQ